MTVVKFYNDINDKLLKFAVIIAKQMENMFSANTENEIH